MVLRTLFMAKIVSSRRAPAQNRPALSTTYQDQRSQSWLLSPAGTVPVWSPIGPPMNTASVSIDCSDVADSLPYE